MFWLGMKRDYNGENLILVCRSLYMNNRLSLVAVFPAFTTRRSPGGSLEGAEY